MAHRLEHRRRRCGRDDCSLYRATAHIWQGRAALQLILNMKRQYVPTSTFLKWIYVFTIVLYLKPIYLEYYIDLPDIGLGLYRPRLG